MSGLALHLVHPACVHFSVAFLTAGGLLEAAGALARRERMERIGGGLVLAGTVSLLPTIVTGYLAFNSVSLPPGGEALVGRHEKVLLAVAALFVGSVFWKAWGRGRIPPSHKPWYAALLLLATGLLAWGAWLGGALVYARGIGVLR